MSFRLPLQISRAVNLTIKSPNIERKVPLCTSWVTLAKRSPACYKNVVAQSEEQQEATELDASTETNKALKKLRELKKKDENFKWYVDSAYLQPKKIETSGKLPSAIVDKYPGNVSYKGAKKEAPIRRATIRTKVWRGSKTSLRRKYSTHATCAPRKPFKSYSFPLVRGRTKDTGLTPSPSRHRAVGRAEGNHFTGAKRAAAGSRPSDTLPSTSKHTHWEYSKRGPSYKPADHHSVSKHVKEVCVEGTVYSERLIKIKKQLFSRYSNVHHNNEETVYDRKEPDFSFGQKQSWSENNHKGEQGNKENSEKKGKHDNNISFNELTQEGRVACAQHASDKADTIKSKLPRLPENNKAQIHSDDARITFTCKRKSQSQRMEPNKRKYFLPKPNFYGNREKTLARGHFAFKTILVRFDESGRKWKHTINHKIGKSKRRQKENSVCQDCCDRRPMRLGSPEVGKLKPQYDASKLKRKNSCEPETGDQRRDDVSGMRTVKKCKLSRLTAECKGGCDDCTILPEAPNLNRPNPEAQCIGKTRTWSYEGCKKNECPKGPDELFGMKVTSKTHPSLLKSPDLNECCEGCILRSDKPRMVTSPGKNMVQRRSMSTLLNSGECVECCEQCPVEPRAPELKRLKPMKITVDRNWKPSDCPHKSCPLRMDDVLGLNVVSKKSLPPLLRSKNCTKCCDGCDLKPDIPKLKRLNYAKSTIDRNWTSSDCPVGTCSPRIDEVLGLNIVPKKTLPSLLNSKDCVKCCQECNYNPEVPKLKRLSMTPKTDRNWKPSDCPVGMCSPRIDDVLGLNVVPKKTLPSLLNSEDCVKCCEECDYNPEVPKLKRLSMTPKTDRNWKPSDCPVGVCPPRMDDLLGLNVTSQKSLPVIPKLENCALCCDGCDLNPEVPKLKRLKSYAPPDRNWKPSDCPEELCPTRMDVLLGLDKTHQKSLPSLLVSDECIECCEDCFFIPKAPVLKRLIPTTVAADRKWKPTDCPAKEACTPRMDELLGMNVIKDKKLPALEIVGECEDCCEDCIFEPKPTPLPRLRAQYDPMDMKKKHKDCSKIDCTTERMDELLGVHVKPKKLPVLMVDDCENCCENCLPDSAALPKLKRLKPKYDPDGMEWKHKACDTEKCPPRMDDLLGLNVVQRLKLPDLKPTEDCEDCCESCPQDACMSKKSARMPKLTGKKSADVRPGQGNGKYSIKSNYTNENLPHIYRNSASGPLSTKRAYATKALKRESCGCSGDRLSTIPTCDQSQDRFLPPPRQTSLQIPLSTESFPNICSDKFNEQKYCQNWLETASRDAEGTRICSMIIEESSVPPARADCKPHYSLEKCGKVPSPYKSFSELKSTVAKSEATQSNVSFVDVPLTFAAAGANAVLAGDGACTMKGSPPVPPTCDLAAEHTDAAGSEKNKSMVDRCLTYCKEKIKQSRNTGECLETLKSGHDCLNELALKKCKRSDTEKLAQKVSVSKITPEMAIRKTKQLLASAKNIRTNIRRKVISTRYTIKAERERVKRKARNRRQRKSRISRISSKIAEQTSECPNNQQPCKQEKSDQTATFCFSAIEEERGRCGNARRHGKPRSVHSSYVSTECTTKTGLNVVIVEMMNEQASGDEPMSQASDAGCPTCACEEELADTRSRSFLQRLSDYFRPK